MQVCIRLHAELQVRLLVAEIGPVPAAAVLRLADIQPEDRFGDPERIGFQSFGEESSGGEDEMVRLQVVAPQVLGDHAVDDALMQVGMQHLVA